MERSTSLKNSIGMLGDLMMLLGVIFIFLGFLCRRYRNIHAKYKGQAEATAIRMKRVGRKASTTIFILSLLTMQTAC